MKLKIYEKAVSLIITYDARTGAERFLYNLDNKATWQQSQVKTVSNKVIDIAKTTDVIYDMHKNTYDFMSYYDWIRLPSKEERAKYICLDSKLIIYIYRAHISEEDFQTAVEASDFYKAIEEITHGAEYMIPKTFENYTYLDLKNSYWRFTS